MFECILQRENNLKFAYSNKLFSEHNELLLSLDIVKLPLFHTVPYHNKKINYNDTSVCTEECKLKMYYFIPLINRFRYAVKTIKQLRIQCLCCICMNDEHNGNRYPAVSIVINIKFK